MIEALPPAKSISRAIHEVLPVVWQVGLQHPEFLPHLEAAPVARYGVPQADPNKIGKQPL